MTENKKRAIAIDGPSGAGKSTLARMTAEHFGFIYVDTGAIYRSVGLFVLRSGTDPKDGEKVAALLDKIDIEISYDDRGVQRMLLNGSDVTADIRMPEASIYASDVSAHPAVRRFLLQMQRELAAKYDVIMDGRDIGTVVLPKADLKIFLSATPEERAMRRFAELTAKGVQTSYENVLSDMKYRDHNDSTRTVAPLRPAEDAVILDTTGFPLEKSFEKIKSIVEESLK